MAAPVTQKPLSEALMGELDTFMAAASQQFRAQATEIWGVAATRATEQIMHRLKASESGQVFPTIETLQRWENAFQNPEYRKYLPDDEYVIDRATGDDRGRVNAICTSKGRVIYWRHNEQFDKTAIDREPKYTEPFPLTLEMCDLIQNVQLTDAPEACYHWGIMIETFREYHPSVPDIAHIVKLREMLSKERADFTKIVIDAEEDLNKRHADLNTAEADLAKRQAALNATEADLAKRQAAINATEVDLADKQAALNAAEDKLAKDRTGMVYIENRLTERVRVLEEHYTVSNAKDARLAEREYQLSAAEALLASKRREQDIIHANRWDEQERRNKCNLQELNDHHKGSLREFARELEAANATLLKAFDIANQGSMERDIVEQASADISAVILALND